MSTALAVIQPNPTQFCHRCGSCCEYIGIPLSPRELQQKAQSTFASPDIQTIYAMLQGRCKGKIQESFDKKPHYFYGPCLHLSYELGSRKAVCGLHGKDEKPWMCKNYPFYQGKFQPHDTENPGYMQGCGYNLDRFSGESPKALDSKLVPLSDGELEANKDEEITDL